MKLRFSRWIIACFIAVVLYAIFFDIKIDLQAFLPVAVLDEERETSLQSEVVVVNGAAAAGDGHDDVDHGNDDDDDDDDARSGLPWFTLHVGPDKTGTTSIQGFLRADETIQYLEKDAYSPPITHNHPPRVGWSVGKLCEWRDDSESQGVDPLQADYKELIQAAIDKGHSFILSDETLRRSELPPLRGSWEVLDTHFNIQIVQTYRRLHEYLPSIYSQVHKKCGPKRETLGCTKWPSVDPEHRAIPTFQSFHQHRYATTTTTTSSDNNNNKQNKKDVFRFTYPNRVDCIHRLYALFQNSSSSNSTEKTTIVRSLVFDMHQQGDMVSNFVCQMIPHANHTCQYIKDKVVAAAAAAAALTKSSSSKQEVNKKMNPAVTVDYDRLAVCAERMGVMNGTLYTNRKEVARQIQTYQENVRKLTDKDLPQDCPSPKIMNFLYQESLRMEEFAMPFMYPNDYQERKNNDKGQEQYHLLPQHLQNFNQSWQMAVKDKTMCNVDCAATLKLPEWKDFFRREFPHPKL